MYVSQQEYILSLFASKIPVCLAYGKYVCCEEIKSRVTCIFDRGYQIELCQVNESIFKFYI